MFSYLFDRYNIDVAGISSDGDPRLLSAMCYEVSSKAENEITVIQDSTHIATKMRNRILIIGICLPMGKFEVSVDHLLMLIRKVSKSEHGLTRTDVCPEDRMNFTSFQKIIDDRVVDSLRKHVKNSDGTIMYLKICNEVTSCFLEVDLTPLDRVFRMWRAVFFLRIWRKFIVSHRSYDIKDNFITYNAHTCIEINARNLIILIKKFRDHNISEQFLTSLFDSQTCEKSFRQFRSMGSINFTKINFSLYELLSLIGRSEVQNDIAYFKLNNKDVLFPHKRVAKSKIYPLPTDEEINATIIKAKELAIENAKEFGMLNTDNIDYFEIKSKLRFQEDENEINTDLVENNIEETYESIDDSEEDGIEEDSPFTIVIDESGIKRVVRKTTYVWMLSEQSEKLSKDRLRRVQVNLKKRKIDEE